MCYPANDWVVHPTFHSSHELALTLRRFGFFLDVLADMGLQVNDKTVALLQLQGSQIRRLQKKYVSNGPRMVLFFESQDVMAVKLVFPFLPVLVQHDLHMGRDNLQCNLNGNVHCLYLLLTYNWISS